MNDACLNLLGEQDFTSFAKLNTDILTASCNITYAKLGLAQPDPIHRTLGFKA